MPAPKEPSDARKRLEDILGTAPESRALYTAFTEITRLRRAVSVLAEELDGMRATVLSQATIIRQLERQLEGLNRRTSGLKVYGGGR